MRSWGGGNRPKKRFRNDGGDEIACSNYNVSHSWPSGRCTRIKGDLAYSSSS